MNTRQLVRTVVDAVIAQSDASNIRPSVVFECGDKIMLIPMPPPSTLGILSDVFNVYGVSRFVTVIRGAYAKCDDAKAMEQAVHSGTKTDAIIVIGHALDSEADEDAVIGIVDLNEDGTCTEKWEIDKADDMASGLPLKAILEASVTTRIEPDYREKIKKLIDVTHDNDMTGLKMGRPTSATLH
jgi:hypothetical protein